MTLTSQQIINYLKDKFEFTIHAHSPDYKYMYFTHNNVRVNVSIVVNTDKNNHTTFNVIVNKAFGEFKYTTMDITFIKMKAFEFALERCRKISSAIEEIE